MLHLARSGQRHILLPTKEMGRKVSEPLLVVPRSVDISVQSCAVQVNDRESEVIVDEPRPASASGSPIGATAPMLLFSPALAGIQATIQMLLGAEQRSSGKLQDRGSSTSNVTGLEVRSGASESSGMRWPGTTDTAAVTTTPVLLSPARPRRPPSLLLVLLFPDHPLFSNALLSDEDSHDDHCGGAGGGSGWALGVPGEKRKK